MLKLRVCNIVLVSALVCAVPIAPGIAEAVSAWADNATVTTLYGRAQGFEDNHSTWVWKALPYARPPVGELRWKAPQDPPVWPGVLQNTEFCSMCPQIDYLGTQAVVGSEDCLYLNIWRPRTPQRNLPVFFWIHGGAFILGSADPYSGAVLAGRHDLVVVTINYRLGPLGWFRHPALRSGQGSLDNSGNFANLDMLKALAWVRDNIEAFGGDPGNVTVAGQSAGGFSVFNLLMSPLAPGLFHRAISQSGSIYLTSPEDGDAAAASLISALLVRDGIPEAELDAKIAAMSEQEISAYLRSKTATDLLRAAGDAKFFSFNYTDGTVLPAEGAAVFSDPKKYNRVPLLFGSTSEEAKLFFFLFGLENKWGPRKYQVLGSVLARMFRMGLEKQAYRLAANPDQPLYCYIFQYGQYRRFGFNAWPTDIGPTEDMSWAVALGACHALDIPFIFGLAGSFDLFGQSFKLLFSEDTRPGWQALSDAMIAYFAQFARTGDPNTAGLPHWTQWPAARLAAGPRFMLFDADASQALINMARDAR